MITTRVAAIVLGVAFAAPVAGAQIVDDRRIAPDTTAFLDTAAVIDTATVVIANRPVLTFRSSLGAQTAAERVVAAGRRLENALESGADQVGVRRRADGMLVTVGGHPIFIVTPADADTVGGTTFDQFVASVVERTEVALAEEFEKTSIRSILRGLLLSLLATIVFVVILRVLRIGRKVSHGRLDEISRRHLDTVSVAGFKLFDRERLIVVVNRLVDVLFWVTGLFVSYLWLTFVLTQFAYSRPWGEALGNYLMSTLSSMLFAIVSGIPGLFTVVVIFVVTRFATRLVAAFFMAIQSESVKLPWVHADTAAPTRRIVVALMWLFAIAVAYPHLPGSDSDVFKGVSVFAGLIITLGSTGVVGQAMSGLVLMYSRSLRVGEYVSIGQTEGTVVELGILATKIRTTKSELVTIPNVVVVATSTKNYSRLEGDRRLVLHTSVTIGYDAPWRQVHAILIEAALKTSDVQAEPAPFVLQTALSDFYVEYQLNAFVEHPALRVRTLAELHQNIQDGFNSHGVQIMSPHFLSQPEQPVVVPREKWHEAPAQQG